MNTLYQTVLPYAVVGLGMVTLAGCSTEGGELSPNTTPSVASSPSQGAGSGSAPYIRFVDLGGGSSVIETYRGPGESTTDRQPSGSTYNVDDRRPIDCRTTGRQVDSRPEQGEEEVSSNVWYRLAFTKKPEYATAVYGVAEPPDVEIPKC
ncbi:MAG TPA: hypothetical protein VJ836_02450 [Candidatus Saccharimonadales bacterium]|nr:hypothetical protein [Candidatus Saccharimonadales bacterium]